MVETEENGPEVGFGPVTRTWFKLGLNVNDEGGADCGKQAGLQLWSTQYNDKGTQKLTKMRVVSRSSLYFFIHSVSYSVVSRLYMA